MSGLHEHRLPDDVEDEMAEDARVIAELGTLLGIWAHPDDEA